MVMLSNQSFCVSNQDFDVFDYVSKTLVLEMTSLKILVLLAGTYLDGNQVIFLPVLVQQLF